MKRVCHEFVTHPFCMNENQKSVNMKRKENKVKIE